MSEPEVFVLADKTLLKVVEQIRDNQWDIKIPDWFQRGRANPDDRLRTIINYHAYDDAWVPDMLAGRSMDEAGKDKFDGDLLGNDPISNFRSYVEKAVAAAEALEDLERSVQCSFGNFTAREYLWQINGFRGLRAYDIAKLIGVDPNLPSELVQGLWDELSPHFEEWRAIGVFPAAVAVPDDADLQTKLLAASGRQP